MWIHTRAAHLAAALSIVAALTACAGATPAPGATPAATPQPSATPPSATEHMGHSMEHGAMSAGAPFDAMFIDSMIVHHEGAITMANQALSEAQRPEIKQLARAIIEAQQREIAQMKQWRAAWYPDLVDTGGLKTDEGHAMDMGPMSVPAGDAPFDIRFIDAMIPHHESAIMMAQMAQQRAERPEIKQLAEAIIRVQSAEIEQMKQWRAAWTQSE